MNNITKKTLLVGELLLYLQEELPENSRDKELQLTIDFSYGDKGIAYSDVVVIPKEVKNTSLLRNSICDLDLMPRSQNILHLEGIGTIGELLLNSENDLRKIPNLGLKTLKEIKRHLAEHGLLLRPEDSK